MRAHLFILVVQHTTEWSWARRRIENQAQVRIQERRKE